VGQRRASKAAAVINSNVVGNRAKKFMLTIIKRLNSYFKRDWNLDDYPIKVYLNESAGEENVKFGARILNWPMMTGHGETEDKALDKLRENFDQFKNTKKLPRPGTTVPLVFAPTKHIEQYEDLAVKFFEKILRLNYFDGFYSDGSYIELSFIDFSRQRLDEIRREIIERTREEFKVDISDVYDEPLWRVFEKIRNGSEARQPTT